VLEGIAGELAQRRRLLDRYRDRFALLEGVECLHAVNGTGNSGQYCVIRVDEDAFGCSRDVLHLELRAYNVFTRKYFYPLCADYDCYRRLPSATAANLPVATRAVREVLCMPLYGGLTESDVDRICDMVVAVREGVRRNVAAGAAE
jgi:dTDP-4-amino-4,6-dideoxygalactose transaminase